MATGQTQIEIERMVLWNWVWKQEKDMWQKGSNKTLHKWEMIQGTYSSNSIIKVKKERKKKKKRKHPKGW